jgi:hypothetical protein
MRGRALPRKRPREGRRARPAPPDADERGAPDRRSFGPTKGEPPVRLMWSVRAMRSPAAHDGSSPPAALVRSTPRTPMRAIVRTPCTTFSAEYPSYRWTRPCMQTTGTPRTRPKHMFPACPATAGAGMCGKSRYGIFTRSSRLSPKAPSPLPRTTPIRGSTFTRFRMAKTLSSSRATIDDGGDCELDMARAYPSQARGTPTAERA